jgi:hypothetical protein
MRVTHLLLFCVTILLIAPLEIEARSKEENKKAIEEIAEYLQNRWNNIPVLTTTVSKGFSLEGTMEYQVETDFCGLMDAISLRLVDATLSYTRTPDPTNKVVSITAGIGKFVEGGWNIFYAAEPHKLSADELLDNGIALSDQSFDLYGFSCEEIAAEDFPEQDDPAWIVFKITYQNRASVYVHGPLRTESQPIY